MLDRDWVERLDLPPAIAEDIEEDSTALATAQLEASEWRSMVEALAPYLEHAEVTA